MSDENPKQDIPGVMKSVIAFESGHYKPVIGKWRGDSVWSHFVKEDGGQVHINKDKVEYIETFKIK